LKLEYDELLSSLAFKFKLRRYRTADFQLNDFTTLAFEIGYGITVGRCRLTLSNPC
jgi:hypothetical protein